MCTRCVRFMKDIDADAQIGVVDRGGHSQIATFGERGVHSLISGNLMDVCPVGAITTRDYRFKSRPWDNPLAVDTTCTLCSKGCSTTAWLKAKPEWAKGAQLIRFTPRFNPDVNGYWMCDIGRFQYHWVEGDARLTTPLAAAGLGRAGEVHLGRRPRHGARTAAAGCEGAGGRVPHAGLGPCVARGAVPGPPAGRPDARLDCRVGGGRVVAIVREGAAQGDEVHGAAGRRAERGGRACDGLPRARRRRWPRATSARFARTSNRAR